MKGQTFMPDYMGSLLVFTLVLTVFLSSWNSVLSTQDRFDQEKTMRTQAYYTSTFLVSTSGHPENWEENPDTIEIPGFANPDHVLQADKLDAFRNLDYDRQRSLLQAQNFYISIKNPSEESIEEGVGNQPVAYITWRNADFSRVRILQALNRSDVEWDLYWPSANDEDKLESLNARNIYNYSDQSEVMFEDVVENASEGNYRSIVSESSNVDPDDISNDDELKTWVENGGSFIHTEEYKTIVNDVFNLQESSDTSSEGTVVNTGHILNESYDVGDSVEFDDNPAAFENPDKVFVEDDASPNGCLACRWDIGEGKLYYIQDTFSDVADYSTTFESGDNAFSPELLFGRQPAEAETIVPIKREVMLNLSDGGVQDTEMSYVVWR